MMRLCDRRRGLGGVVLRNGEGDQPLSGDDVDVVVGADNGVDVGDDDGGGGVDGDDLGDARPLALVALH